MRMQERRRYRATSGQRHRCAIVGLMALIAASMAQGHPMGEWRWTHSVAAPWAQGPVPAPEWVGRTLTLDGDRMRGPDPLNCGGARVESLLMPHEGLFQGGLPVPVERSAQALGVGPPPVPGWRVTCDTGVFDFHRVDEETAVIGLDNRIWTLSRAPGTRAHPDSPSGRVQSFLERHFAADPATALRDFAARRTWWSRGLSRLIERYNARAPRPDEVPAINGDPFTDSQEYPTRFSVGRARVQAHRASVPVTFADALQRRVLVYRLVREGGQWALDDIDYGRGEHLRQALR